MHTKHLTETEIVFNYHASAGREERLQRNHPPVYLLSDSVCLKVMHGIANKT